jgi:branched-chain amino acid aminotransferase
LRIGKRQFGRVGIICGRFWIDLKAGFLSKEACFHLLNFIKMVNYNGSLADDKEPILTAANRAFRYGDGVFETMRSIDGKIPLLPYHFDRILRGMRALHIHVPSYFNRHYLSYEIAKTIENQPFSRVRLLVFREAGGAYTPTSYNPDFLVEAAQLPDKNFQWHDMGLTVGIYEDMALQQTPYSAFKTNNALPYILASIAARENSWDEALMRSNTEGGIAEATTSNIFTLKAGKWLTPPLSSGCVGGVFRKFLLEHQNDLKINVLEHPLSKNDLNTADEIFLTNAVQGIRWVEKFGDMEFGCAETQQVFDRFKAFLRSNQIV